MTSQGQPALLVPAFFHKRETSLIIATSSHCNARCHNCIWPFMQPAKKVMSLPQFDQLLERFTGFRFGKLAFNVINEPFIDKTIEAKIQRVAELRLSVKDLFFSSNWLLCDASRLDHFIGAIANCAACAAIAQIRLCATVNGIDQQSYDVEMAGRNLQGSARPMPALSFSKACDNVLRVLQRLQAGPATRKITFEIKAYGNAFSEMQLRQFWQRAFQEHNIRADWVHDRVRIRHNYAFCSFARWPPTGTMAPRRMCNRRYCDTVLTVGPSGEVGLCCQEGIRDINMGNLLEGSLEDLIKLPEFQRQYRIAAGLEEPPDDHPCTRCEFFQHVKVRKSA